ncbi:MAG: hypothetical protein IPO60_01375 [Flavobacteriales bacterium]|jgi:hypothetical protein|nr:hypothetical protein [Flavobacteriales bacterium]MBK6891701.1 hypothetical protein [Flavobacteriales bacterium]MBK7247625.1 hypothetical protein [Flavobacteriales bacterium]MBK7286572.1 hypothetical protein [Flavobacteriales bacterium]MBK9060537.1 hypothetical protein [Flavobacteriales bacterium]
MEKIVVEARPVMLTRLCVASFINQGVVFPIYLIGILGAYAIKSMSVEEVRQIIETTWSSYLKPDQQDALLTYVGVMRAHGVALMGVFALRTLARFVGVFRMWNGKFDGFHIYTSAQLLGMLVPIMIAGSATLNILGFFLALNWCYLYFIHRKSLK